MPDTTIASALADLDKSITGRFTSGLHHGISIGRRSAVAELEYAGYAEAAALVRAMDDGNELPARYRHTATELEYFSDLDELPADYAWSPSLLRFTADALEANP